MGTKARRFLMGDFEPACLLRLSSKLWLCCLVTLTVATRVRADDLANAGRAASTGELMGIVGAFLVAVTGLINSWHRRKGRATQREGSGVDHTARAGLAALERRVGEMSELATEVRVEQAREMVAMENRLNGEIGLCTEAVAAARADVGTTLERHHRELFKLVQEHLMPPTLTVTAVATPPVVLPPPAASGIPEV